MKKKLLFTIGIIGLLFYSCESKDPVSDTGGGGGETLGKTPTKEYIYKDVMVDNYLWEVPTSPDYSLNPEALFKSLRNPADVLSRIWKTSETSNLSSDPGFEYAINNYEDNQTLYIIYYVKHNSDAESKGLKRGYIISEVNGKKVTKENSSTLLRNEANLGGSLTLKTFHPSSPTNSFDFTITPTPVGFEENPIYITTDTIVNGDNVGYILYNRFRTQEGNTNYDNQLANKLQDFYNKDIKYLVLDLRYNPGGSLPSAQVLGSALVKQRDISQPYIINQRRANLGNISLNLLDLTPNGVTIPKLGDKLKRIYIITGQYTAATSETFINSLRAYWGNQVILVGEKTTGQNPHLARKSMISKPDGEWSMEVLTAYIADRFGKYDYAKGFSPNVRVTEVSEKYNLMLHPLGSTGETVYKAVINLIINNPIKSAIDSSDRPSSLEGSSIESNLNFNKTFEN